MSAEVAPENVRNEKMQNFRGFRWFIYFNRCFGQTFGGVRLPNEKPLNKTQKIFYIIYDFIWWLSFIFSFALGNNNESYNKSLSVISLKIVIKIVMMFTGAALMIY